MHFCASFTSILLRTIVSKPFERFLSTFRGVMPFFMFVDAKMARWTRLLGHSSAGMSEANRRSRSREHQTQSKLHHHIRPISFQWETFPLCSLLRDTLQCAFQQDQSHTKNCGHRSWELLRWHHIWTTSLVPSGTADSPSKKVEDQSLPKTLITLPLFSRVGLTVRLLARSQLTFMESSSMVKTTFRASSQRTLEALSST